MTSVLPMKIVDPGNSRSFYSCHQETATPSFQGRWTIRTRDYERRGSYSRTRLYRYTIANCSPRE